MRPSTPVTDDDSGFIDFIIKAGCTLHLTTSALCWDLLHLHMPSHSTYEAPVPLLGDAITLIRY